MAEEIRRRQVSNINTDGTVLVSYPALGINSTHRFLKRHPQLATLVSQQLDLAR